MKRFLHLVALLAAFALVTGLSAAIAATHPDNRPTHGPGAVTLEQESGVVRPDDRAAHGPGALALVGAGDAVRPDDRATHGQGAIAIEQLPGSGRVPVVGPEGSEATRLDGFDWVDATIGAAAALGLGLIVAGGVVFALRRASAPLSLPSRSPGGTGATG
jgi:hypothetical protein